jgi:hypothetical protein
MAFVSACLILYYLEIAYASGSLALLRGAPTPPPTQNAPASLSLGAVSRDSFSPPTIQDYKVEEITSESVPLLDEIASEASVQKRRAQYSSLSEDDLKIPIRMASIQSPLRYLVTPPPSTCDGATGPAAKLLDCSTTFPMFRIDGV